MPSNGAVISKIATPVSLDPVPGIAPLCGAILVVEDEAFVRKVTCEVLQSAGHRVLQARHGREAVSLFREHGHAIQLLLTDVVLPGQNGCNLAQHLSALRPELKTIFISGYPQNAISQDGRQPPGTYYLPKPFSVQSLLRKVKEVLSPESVPRQAAGTG